ncbi:RNA-binding protein with multiple splicing [Porphyridium purpureum]|uniref:RNA-binding protein with multiple splicing n=1 Tax=Porphyridium purpureum TaxID=35688 RepID=A0A5J4YMM9_PORPP|nr:RNA-binding protein with multiple splicing [Porphyridium purpureum]|eukprot:POR5812..scf249_10
MMEGDDHEQEQPPQGAQKTDGEDTSGEWGSGDADKEEKGEQVVGEGEPKGVEGEEKVPRGEVSALEPQPPAEAPVESEAEGAADVEKKEISDRPHGQLPLAHSDGEHETSMLNGNALSDDDSKIPKLAPSQSPLSPQPPPPPPPAASAEEEAILAAQGGGNMSAAAEAGAATDHPSPSQNAVNDLARADSSATDVLSASEHAVAAAAPVDDRAADKAVDLQPPQTPSETNDAKLVRTLYVNGWPSDTREREVHNLFRVAFPSYEGCNMRTTTSRTGQELTVFALFELRSEAEHALRVLHGYVFDEETGQKLRVEWARANTRAKRGRRDGMNQALDDDSMPSKRPRTDTGRSGGRERSDSGRERGGRRGGDRDRDRIGSSSAPQQQAPVPQFAQPAMDLLQQQQQMMMMANPYGNAATAMPGWQQQSHPQTQQQPGLSASAAASGFPGFSAQQLMAVSDAVNATYNYATPGLGQPLGSQQYDPYNAQLVNSAAYSAMGGGTGLSAAAYGMNTSGLMDTSAGGAQAISSRRGGNAPKFSGEDNPPCATLFVGNIVPSTSEGDLRPLFSQLKGFIGVRISRTARSGNESAVGFADFEDTVYSTQALMQCQGYQLPCCRDQTGIRLMYAKNRTGAKRN